MSSRVSSPHREAFVPYIAEVLCLSESVQALYGVLFRVQIEAVLYCFVGHTPNSLVAEVKDWA